MLYIVVSVGIFFFFSSSCVAAWMRVGENLDKRYKGWKIFTSDKYWLSGRGFKLAPFKAWGWIDRTTHTRGKAPQVLERQME